MDIALPRSQEAYIASLVESGGYSRGDEVVAEALLEHQARRKGVEIVMTSELERLLDEGLENLDRAKTTEQLRPAKVTMATTPHDKIVLAVSCPQSQ